MSKLEQALEPFEAWIRSVDLYPIETAFCPDETPDIMVVDDWLPDEKAGFGEVKIMKLCPHCGKASKSHVRCSSCGRRFGTMKGVANGN